MDPSAHWSTMAVKDGWRLRSCLTFWIHKKLAPKWLNGHWSTMAVKDGWPANYISHGFPSVHHVHASITLPPNGATLLFRSLPMELSPIYFPRVPVRPPSLPCRSLRTELAPSYFPRFPSVHLVVASVLLPPNGALPKLFLTVSRTLPTRSLPWKLSSTVSRPSSLSSLKCRSPHGKV